MKKIMTLILLISVSGIAYSQDRQYSENDTVPKVIYPKGDEADQPLILLNDQYASRETLQTIKPDSIESINIEKGDFNLDGKEYSGKIIIKTKPGYHPKLVTLSELLSRYTTVGKNAPCIYSIEEEVINADAEKYLVDEKNIMQIKVIKLDKIDYLKGLYWIKIVNRTPENLKEANTIRIRGNKNWTYR